ncbi:MAG TPA: putative Na+/H+ antiporter [Nevskiaceae bacterium]|nr:putative Na+/H+ antiporter [Nevskiaceae bacterium]
MTPTLVQTLGALLFAVALLHTFSTGVFERLAHRHPAHAGTFHLLGEVEVVFGFWAMILIALMFVAAPPGEAIAYVESRNFTEPLFVFAIMVVAGSRPILSVSTQLVQGFARLLPLPRPVAIYFGLLFLVPLLGSFITEPAAMTLAALLLRDRYFGQGLSTRFKYATLGVLFVNISIGGVLTPFAAPPVLMVAATWNWDIAFMLTQFGWKAVIAVMVNAVAVTALFQRELKTVGFGTPGGERPPVPLAVVLINLLLLGGVVVFAHHPPIFLALMLLFIGFADAYKQHQDRLILREGLLVAFFLAGLVVLGGQQQWWLQPLLLSMSPDAVYFGATALTAITDNAALTYLGSLVPGLSDEFKYMLVAGAVTGGGLTVIANAPNPAGYSILKGRFEDETISALGLLTNALPPTAVAIVCFYLL